MLRIVFWLTVRELLGTVGGTVGNCWCPQDQNTGAGPYDTNTMPLMTLSQDQNTGTGPYATNTMPLMTLSQDQNTGTGPYDTNTMPLCPYHRTKTLGRTRSTTKAIRVTSSASCRLMRKTRREARREARREIRREIRREGELYPARVCVRIVYVHASLIDAPTTPKVSNKTHEN